MVSNKYRFPLAITSVSLHEEAAMYFEVSQRILQAEILLGLNSRVSILHLLLFITVYLSFL